MKKEELSALLYEFLEVIYLFQKREEGLFGAGWQEIYLLKKIADAGGMSVGGIAQVLHIPLFGASRIVNRLKTAGWVKKTPEKDNKRVITVGITAAGKKLLGKVENYQYKLITKNIAVLKADELASITSGLAKLRLLLDIPSKIRKEAHS